MREGNKSDAASYNLRMERMEKFAKDLGVELALLDGARATTFRGGGRAYAFCPKSEEEFEMLLAAMWEEGIVPFLLGGGSNVILNDGILQTPLIFTAALNKITFTGDSVVAGCGLKVATLAAEMKKRGAGGLEFLAGVPASVGGAAKMNAGAFGQDMAQALLSARVFDENDGKIKTMYPKDFKYRQGFEGYVIDCAFKLSCERVEDIEERTRRYIAYRRERQPRLPSAGSVFKNGDVPSGELIEECGLKGTRAGGAQISPVHANFIVNLGGATAADFLALAALAERSVFEKFGIKLEREFKLVES